LNAIASSPFARLPYWLAVFWSFCWPSTPSWNFPIPKPEKPSIAPSLGYGTRLSAPPSPSSSGGSSPVRDEIAKRKTWRKKPIPPFRKERSGNGFDIQSVVSIAAWRDTSLFQQHYEVWIRKLGQTDFVLLYTVPNFLDPTGNLNWGGSTKVTTVS